MRLLDGVALSKHPLYATWTEMKRRCRVPTRRSYERYGGRGIRVCEEWSNDFVAFARYMGPKPGPGYSIDRIDNDGNYEPGNVRWATQSQQIQNQSANNGATWQASKTHCPQGHPYSGANLFFSPRPNGVPRRQCRECRRARGRIWHKRNSEKINARHKANYYAARSQTTGENTK